MFKFRYIKIAAAEKNTILIKHNLRKSEQLLYKTFFVYPVIPTVENKNCKTFRSKFFQKFLIYGFEIYSVNLNYED